MTVEQLGVSHDEARELFVVARRPHRDGDLPETRRAVLLVLQPDFERLLDGGTIPAVPARPGLDPKNVDFMNTRRHLVIPSRATRDPPTSIERAGRRARALLVVNIIVRQCGQRCLTLQRLSRRPAAGRPTAESCG